MAESQGSEAHTSGEVLNGGVDVNGGQSLKALSIGEVVDGESGQGAMEHSEPPSLAGNTKDKVVSGDMEHTDPQNLQANTNGKHVDASAVNGEAVIGDMEYEEPPSLDDHTNDDTVNGDMEHTDPQTLQTNPNSKNANQGALNSEPINGEVVIGDMEYDGRVILYIIKADETSYINYIKPLILAVELGFPHVFCCIDTKTQWAYKIHPERMVPALKDRDAVTGQEVIVFEGTACLQYLADRFDGGGAWTGRTAFERGNVLAWTAYQTAGIGATAKYWLYFLRGYPTRANPEQLPKTIKKLHQNTIRQWDILEQRLRLPDQQYIALKDRPTLADLSYFPFAMPWMFGFLGVDIKDWPAIEGWSRRMLERKAVREIMERAKGFGH